MDLFMRNVDYALTWQQVVRELAQILHQPPFTTVPANPINFNVHLHRATNLIHNNKGTGVLTLPSEEIGLQFLRLDGTDQPMVKIRIGTRETKFQISIRPVDPAIVGRINTQPFRDPSTRIRQRRPEVQGDTVTVKAIQFGWFCRDHAFSVEWQYICVDRCNITFPEGQREIRINLTLLEGDYFIVLSLSSVTEVSASTNMAGEHSLVFDLNTPPSYERKLIRTVRNAPERQKLSYLPIPDHDRVAPFASLAVRVLCRDERDLSAFRTCCRKVDLRRVSDYDFPVVYRNLFSLSVMSRVQAHLTELDWDVAFQMESLLRSLAVDFLEAEQLFPEISQTVAQMGSKFTAAAINKFKNTAKVSYLSEDETEFDVIRSFRLEVEGLISEGDINPPADTGDSSYESFHVEVTPTTMILEGPFTEQSNRVIRAYDSSYHDCFLRVSFVDEGRLHYRFDREVDGHQFIKSRVGPLLYDGLNVAGRRFEFLAYSQSALKEHAVWFVKPFRNHAEDDAIVNAESIISSLGTFHGLQFDRNLIYCPARYAARISQAFTATDAVKVEVENVIQIPDISTHDGKYHFTDGVGTISRELSKSIWRRLRKSKRKRPKKEAPSSYQIRFMGSKGMLSVDYTLSGSTICLRPTMIKFMTPETVRDIEVARAFDRPTPYFLNRPLIMLLEGLGVPFEVFKRHQDKAVEETRKAGRSVKDAAVLFETHGLGASFHLPSILHNLEKLGLVGLEDDEFYKKMLEFGINHVLRDLKNRARILVPGAWTLVGVADVHKFLQPNQIFACIKPVSGGKRYLTGRVLVSRSPTIHPGDVAIVEAIGEPPVGSCFAEENLTNTVVFSVLGSRPIPSCLGGGDLDGDLYNLIPLDDPELPHLHDFDPGRICEPANYEAPTRKELNRPSTMKDVADFVMEFILSDTVGVIAINWLITADISPRSIFDPNCLLLSTLHSKAVDFPKTGQPVPFSELPNLRYPRKPDWNAPETINANNSRYYSSERAIGKLFRAIDLPIEQQGSRRRRRRNNRVREEPEVDVNQPDPRQTYLFEVVQDRVNEFMFTDDEPNEEETNSIQNLLSRYSSGLQAICMAHTLLYTPGAQISEAEAIMGTIAQKTSQPRRRQEMIAKVRGETEKLARGVRESLFGDDDFSVEDCLHRAWKAWELSVFQNTFGAKSFSWVALGIIFELIKDIEDEQRTGSRLE